MFLIYLVEFDDNELFCHLIDGGDHKCVLPLLDALVEEVSGEQMC